MGLRVDGFGGYVNLDVVSITVETEAVAMDNLTEREEVEDEEERAKHGALWDALGQGGSRGRAVVDENKLFPVCKV